MAENSLQEYLADGYAVAEPPSSDVLLAQTARLLHTQREEQAAALLLDVERLELVSDGCFWHQDDLVVRLEVQPFLVPRFDDDVRQTIVPVIYEVAGRHGIRVCRCSVEVRASLPTYDPAWRTTLQDDLAVGNVTNQGRRPRLDGDRFRRDGLSFTNRHEQAVYEVLVAMQAELPADDTFTIAPLPGVRLAGGNVWEPDFLLVYRKRAGVLEVDGPHHGQRRAADTSRDRRLYDHGMAWVERLLVEDTRSAQDVRVVVGRLLRRLAEG